MYCSNCGKEIPDNKKVCFHCGYNNSKRKLIYFVTVPFILCIFFSLVGLFGYRHYKIFMINKQLEEAVGKDTGYTETILKTELDSPHMTFAEFFKLCDESIEGRTKLIISLRGLYPDIKYELKDKLIEFLNSENELVRTKKAFYRSRLNFNSNLEMLSKHISDKPSSIYGYPYFLKRMLSIKSDLIEAISNMVENSESFIVSYKKLIEQEITISDEMEKTSIRFIKVFKKYEESNNKIIKDSKESADKVRKILS